MVLKTEWFVRGFVESVFVVGSILLALGVDEWTENRGFSDLADQSLGIFEQEIIQNRDRVADGLPYHQGIRDVLGQMMATPPPVIDLRRIMGDVEPPVLLNTAWETSLATGALTHMDFEVVSALSLTYSFQEDFTARSRADLPRIDGAEDQSARQVSEQVRTAYEYVAALTQDEADLLTIFQEALTVVSQHRGAEAMDSVAPQEPEGS
jgi:hypothetical protein